MAKKKNVQKVEANLFTPTKADNIFNMLETYDAFNTKIQRDGGYAALRKMYKHDDEIAAATDTRLEACVSTDWSIEGPDEELNDFMYSLLAPHVETMAGYLWWAVPYGYAVTEVIYDEERYRRTGVVAPKQILDVPFYKYVPHREGFLTESASYILYRNTSATTDPEAEPIEPKGKFFHVVNKPSAESPYGEAIYERLYLPFIYRCHGWEFFMQYLESWGTPFLHGKTESKFDAGTSQIEQLNYVLGGLKRPKAVITDKETEIAVIGSNQGGMVFPAFNTAVNERIQRMILGQTLTSGTSGVGSQALGNVHNEVRMDKKRSDCKLVAKGINQLILELLRLNRIITDEPPVFKMEDPQGLEPERADRDVKLASTGQIKFTEKYLMERYDFTEGDFEITEAPLTPPEGDGIFSEAERDILQMIDGNHIHKFADPERLNPRQKASFDLETQAIEAAGDLIDSEELQALIRSSKSEKDLSKKLEAFIDKDNSTFTDVFTRALYISRLKGYIDGKENVEA